MSRRVPGRGVTQEVGGTASAGEPRLPVDARSARAWQGSDDSKGITKHEQGERRHRWQQGRPTCCRTGHAFRWERQSPTAPKTLSGRHRAPSRPSGTDPQVLSFRALPCPRSAAIFLYFLNFDFARW
jgi:hypothetical protein